MTCQPYEIAGSTAAYIGKWVNLLEEVLAVDAEGKKAIGQLRALIEEKNLVSYSGEIYRREDIRSMTRHLERYQSWASQLFTR